VQPVSKPSNFLPASLSLVTNYVFAYCVCLRRLYGAPFVKRLSDRFSTKTAISAEMLNLSDNLFYESRPIRLVYCMREENANGPCSFSFDPFAALVLRF